MPELTCDYAFFSFGDVDGADPKGDDANIAASIERYDADIEACNDTANGEGTGIEGDGHEIERTG
jgi:hypothetical protein